MDIAEPPLVREHPNAALESFFRLRKVVFIDNLRWDLPETEGKEIDQFDTPTAYYSLVLSGGQVLTGARGTRVSVQNKDSALIHVMFDLFPTLKVPITDCDWDVTRLCLNPHSSTWRVKKVLAFWLVFNMQWKRASSEGCSRMLAVSSPKIARHFAKFGLKTKQISALATIPGTGSEIAVFEFRLS